MEPFYDYKKFAVLYVDDEEKSLKYFKETFGDQFTILTAPNAEEGFRILKENIDRIAILVTDQRMPGEKGVQLLEKSRQIKPRVLRILVTAYSDLETAIDSVNTGAIYKYITKPWDVPQLGVTLKRALEFFIVQNERDHLLHEKMSVLHNMMMTDRILSLGILATGLSHHMRNSMVAIKTFLDLAPRKLKEENIEFEELRNPDFWKDYYQKVQGQMDKVVRLLGDLWESSEKPQFEFSDKVQLKVVVQKAFQEVGAEMEKKKIQFKNEIPADLPALQVDQRKFQKLFELLLKEEGASVPAGGQVLMKARLLGTAPGPQEIELTVEDNGPGVSPGDLRSVFDPFFVRSGNPQEVGLYLMTCFFIIYHHGGRIEAAAGPEGKGVRYVVTFPLNPSQKTVGEEEGDFFKRLLLNETLWEKLLAES